MYNVTNLNKRTNLIKAALNPLNICILKNKSLTLITETLPLATLKKSQNNCPISCQSLGDLSLRSVTARGWSRLSYLIFSGFMPDIKSFFSYIPAGNSSNQFYRTLPLLVLFSTSNNHLFHMIDHQWGTKRLKTKLS